MTMYLTPQNPGELSLHVEELESLDQADFGNFTDGLGVGLAIVGLVAAGIALGVT